MSESEKWRGTVLMPLPPVSPGDSLGYDWQGYHWVTDQFEACFPTAGIRHIRLDFDRQIGHLINADDESVRDMKLHRGEPLYKREQRMLIHYIESLKHLTLKQIEDAVKDVDLRNRVGLRGQWPVQAPAYEGW